jgi:hypothetical protein
MKKPVFYNIDEGTYGHINLLSEKLGITKTAAVEGAIYNISNSFKAVENLLLRNKLTTDEVETVKRIIDTYGDYMNSSLKQSILNALDFHQLELLEVKQSDIDEVEKLCK